MHRRPAGHILVGTLYGPNTRAYSDLPAVDILNLIDSQSGSSHVASGYDFHIATCLFCGFSCAINTAVLVACNLE